MARAHAIKPYFMQSQGGRACAELAGGALARPLAPGSGEVRDVREVLGSDGEKSNGDKVLVIADEVPERFATLAKCSGRFLQVLAPVRSSSAFGSDSRGRSVFDEVPPPKDLDKVIAAGKIDARGSSS